MLYPLSPSTRRRSSSLNTSTDPNSGQKTVSLTLEQAITQTLANSPDIRVVSFDPEIARQDIKKAAADFDPVEFEQMSWDKQDSPPTAISSPGRRTTAASSPGVRQKNDPRLGMVRQLCVRPQLGRSGRPNAGDAG